MKIGDELRITNGRRQEDLICAAIFLAAQLTEEVVSPDDITRIAITRRRDIFRAYKALKDGLKLYPEPTQPEKFVEDFVTRLNEQCDSNLPDDVVDTTEVADDLFLSSRHCLINTEYT